MAKATINNVTLMFREAAYPLYLVDVEQPEIEIEILSYGYINILQTPDEDGISLVVIDDDHPIRYLISDVDVEESTFISRDKTISVINIDESDLM